MEYVLRKFLVGVEAALAEGWPVEKAPRWFGILSRAEVLPARSKVRQHENSPSLVHPCKIFVEMQKRKETSRFVFAVWDH